MFSKHNTSVNILAALIKKENDVAWYVWLSLISDLISCYDVILKSMLFNIHKFPLLH